MKKLKGKSKKAKMKRFLNVKFLFLISLCLCVSAVNFRAQTGGNFDLSHNVIASGGSSDSAGGNFSVSGTVGQNSAGAVSVGGSFSVRGGFWAFDSLAPTAAKASISGRIKTINETGIKNVLITLTKVSNGEILQNFSSSFGYYQFSNLTVGEVYILTVKSKTFSFSPNSRVIFLSEELTDQDFTGFPNE